MFRARASFALQGTTPGRGKVFMARIDSILGIVVSQGANELRVGADREPRMLAYGIAKKLSIPSTPADTLRELLGEILTREREEAMRAKGRVEVAYDAGALGAFKVTLTARGDTLFDAAFVRDGARAGSRAAAAGPVIDRASQASEPGAKLGPPVLAVSAPASGILPAAPPAPLSEVEPPDAGRDRADVRYVPSAQHGATETLARLVARASAVNASDLHLADDEIPVLRVDGALRRLGDEDGVSVAGVLGLDEHAVARVRAGDSVDLAIEVTDVGRVRVHVYRADERLAAAIRMLPRAAPSLASLHMPMPLDDIVDLPQGLVLVCGATGSGKSTTLAALAQEIVHRRSVVLTTLEDPIEYAITPPPTSLVRRRQVRRDVRDFASGLRDALREDPDVLLVGEMRDPETIGLALTAAETGHLVLASMHSRSSASAVERIVDSYAPERQQQIRVQLADSLRAVIAQRLLPRARGGGRLPAIEVLRVTHAVANIIREGKTAQLATSLQSGRREGMLALERCLADRVLAGEIRVEDARAAANDPASLARYLAG
jgi:twitching motility protein PilT